MKGKQDFVHKDRQTACTYDISKKNSEANLFHVYAGHKKSPFLWANGINLRKQVGAFLS